MDTGYRGKGGYKTVQYIHGGREDGYRTCRIDKEQDTGQDLDWGKQKWHEGGETEIDLLGLKGKCLLFLLYENAKFR